MRVVRLAICAAMGAGSDSSGVSSDSALFNDSHAALAHGKKRGSTFISLGRRHFLSHREGSGEHHWSMPMAMTDSVIDVEESPLCARNCIISSHAARALSGLPACPVHAACNPDASSGRDLIFHPLAGGIPTAPDNLNTGRFAWHAGVKHMNTGVIQRLDSRNDGIYDAHSHVTPTRLAVGR